MQSSAANAAANSTWGFGWVASQRCRQCLGCPPTPQTLGCAAASRFGRLASALNPYTWPAGGELEAGDACTPLCAAEAGGGGALLYGAAVPLAVRAEAGALLAALHAAPTTPAYLTFASRSLSASAAEQNAGDKAKKAQQVRGRYVAERHCCTLLVHLAAMVHKRSSWAQLELCWGTRARGVQPLGA